MTSLDGVNPKVLVDQPYCSLGNSKPLIPADGELHLAEVQLEKYYLNKYEVSNKEFAVFVEATGYVTEVKKSCFSIIHQLFRQAEKFGNSFVHEKFLSKEANSRITQAVTINDYF